MRTIWNGRGDKVRLKAKVIRGLARFVFGVLKLITDERSKRKFSSKAGEIR